MAVASKFPAVGALVPWVAAGVGAVATQSVMHAPYGHDGLALLRDGLDPEVALARLTSADDGRENRQVAIVDASGRSATHTGRRCLDWAGGRCGPGWAAQGNLLVSDATIDAMVESFTASAAGSPLAPRLLDALAAGQDAGGDRRGQQAAALIVARPGGGYGGNDIPVDLRVDDHVAPVTDLRRLYAIHDRCFGSTPSEEWLPVDETLAGELGALLAALGHASGSLASDLMDWALVENLEERVTGARRVDPVVVSALREAAGA